MGRRTIQPDGKGHKETGLTPDICEESGYRISSRPYVPCACHMDDKMWRGRWVWCVCLTGRE
jgi:hypothetical protein